uniref:Serpin domain-containing protein n=1 Tax=Monopterus albus TaxID=43700 RepID=A0A3Q3K1P9_MONAL
VLLFPASCEPMDSSVEVLTNRNADFAARLYRAIASRTDDNVLLAPFTLSTGLLALLSATNGSTQDQLMQGLTLIGLDPQTLPDLFQNLRAIVLPEGGATNLQQGMAILPAQSYQVLPFYLDLVQTKFGGEVQNLAYTATEEAIATINRLAQERTSDRVEDLVTNLDPQTQLLITTAAFYQTRFSPSFNSSLSQDERFYVDRYHVVMVPMMFSSDKYFLAYDRSTLIPLHTAVGPSFLPYSLFIAFFPPIIFSFIHQHK